MKISRKKLKGGGVGLKGRRTKWNISFDKGKRAEGDGMMQTMIPDDLLLSDRFQDSKRQNFLLYCFSGVVSRQQKVLKRLVRKMYFWNVFSLIFAQSILIRKKETQPTFSTTFSPLPPSLPSSLSFPFLSSSLRFFPPPPYFLFHTPLFIIYIENKTGKENNRIVGESSQMFYDRSRRITKNINSPPPHTFPLHLFTTFDKYSDLIATVNLAKFE